jgi:hypothetical protein
VFDENICDTLMCVDMVQNLLVIEFVLGNKKKEAGKYYRPDNPGPDIFIISGP